MITYKAHPFLSVIPVQVGIQIFWYEIESQPTLLTSHIFVKFSFNQLVIHTACKSD